MDINSVNNYNKINKDNGNLAHGKKEEQKVSETNEILLASLKDAENHNDIESFLASAVNNHHIRQIGTLLYQSDDYIYADLLKFYAEPQAKSLKRLSEKKLGIVPKFVDLIEKGNYSVLVTQIEGLNGKDLIPFSKGYNLLSEEAKKSAYQDVQKLLAIGLINQDMLRGTNAFYINPETKEVVVPFWDKLRPINGNEAPEILNTLYKTIFNK